MVADDRPVDLRLAEDRFVDLRLAEERPVDLRLAEDRPVDLRLPPARRLRVAAALRAEAEREALLRAADARPPFLPPFRDAVRVVFLPRPDPLFFPPLVSLLTVAHARRAASPRETPRSSYPSSMCRA
ncbi:MAG TPA: hypothetical protein VEB59_06385 [Gemmatimonadales bacterium]|nr:hypothetical protein [Gemmatimonadales bacterium]